MKTKIFIMLSLVFFTLFSCEKNKVEGVIEEEPYWREISYDPYGLMDDGGYINHLYMQIPINNKAYDRFDPDFSFEKYSDILLSLIQLISKYLYR